MKDLLGKSAPTLDAPLEMLSACHGRVFAQLQTLQRLQQWLPQHGADEQARQAARNIMRYFDVAAVDHHADEEFDLLPAMQQAAHEPAQRQEVARLRAWVLADHERLFACWARMRTRLETIANGESVELSAEAVETFSRAYRDHIAREESELLPYAERLLGADSLARMSHAMTARRRRP